MAGEVCFLIGAGDQILWADASDDPSALPDSRKRWEAIWTHREALVEIAHSHPHGPDRFSHEDETTMEALGHALASAPTFSIVSPGGMRRRHPSGEETSVDDEPWWAALLRLASGMQTPNTQPQED